MVGTDCRKAPDSLSTAMDSLETPVALFVFNRPEPTREVFAAVRQARPRRLLVVADGPRPDRGDAERESCAAVRGIVEAVDWDCRVDHLYAEQNLGCGARVSSGLDWVFDTVPEAIVLEDDCLPAPDFFPFAQAMLERYRDDQRIGMIAGTNYLPQRASEAAADYLFSRYYAIWGWAAWARSWRDYHFTMPSWPALRDQVAALYDDPGLAAYVSEMFDLVHAGAVDTWDVQWFYTCLTTNRLSVVPRANLVSNIGYEGTRPTGPYQGMATGSLDAGALREPAFVLPDTGHERRMAHEILGALPAPSPTGWKRALARLR
jgi:hypothetical protein